MTSEELLELLERPEGLKLDFKREYKLSSTPPSGVDRQEWNRLVNGQWDELIKDVIALTNGNVGTAGESGFLVIGADDELPARGARKIYDISHLNLTTQQVLARVNSACDPPLSDIVCESVTQAGKQVYVITIPFSPHFHETSRRLVIRKGVFDASGALRHIEEGQTYTARTGFIRRGENVFPATADERQAIVRDKRSFLQRIVAQTDLDRILFVKIQVILNRSESIWYVRETDYTGIIETEYHRDLYGFLDFCKSPECEFLDEDLERLRVQLEGAIDRFLGAIGRHTFPQKINVSWNRIPRDPMQDPELLAWFVQKADSREEFGQLIEEQRENIREVGEELNRLANQVCDAYNEFVRRGRRRLAG
jgi:hypothetical protein